MKTNIFSSFGNKALQAAQAGFTMIELLVVIAVIGVLSVAVLSSINPIEQINKGRDTRARSDAAQLINAVDRYFAIAEEYPWNVDTPEYAATLTQDGDYAEEFVFSESDPTNNTAPDGWGWTELLVTNNEIKPGFRNRLESDTNLQYHIEKPAGQNTSMSACFLPSSNAFQDDALEACSDAGQRSSMPSDACPTTCYTDGDKETCMICLP
jgi:prepilin-type N-terminal cleavage/methylation domain-containing protein